MDKPKPDVKNTGTQQFLSERSKIKEVQLIENNSNGQISYNSVLLPPQNLAVLASNLSLKIITELAKEPGCAMDLARSLNEHEQKIYYHLRRLEKAGIVNLKKKEKRYGMTANIFGLASPVVAAKLHEDGRSVKESRIIRDPKIENFLHPFIKESQLNCSIVVGNPYSHGKFDKGATEGVHMVNLAFMMGGFINKIDFSRFKLDTEMENKDLKDNLIVLGNPQTNVIIDKLNRKMPIYFDIKRDCIISRNSGKSYTDVRTGIVMKINNPFKKDKKILVLGGKTRGTRASVLACTKYLHMLIENDSEIENMIRVVRGFDKSGNGVIDSVTILE